MSLTVKIKPLLLVGASGSGRAALSFRLLCSLPHKFERVVSHTTRKPRQNQLNNINFHFIDEDIIMQLFNQQKFITLTKSSHDHYYGLTREQIQRVISNHKIPIFKLTLQAYKQQILNRNWHFDHYAIYIRVSNLNQLANRLQYGPFSEKQIQQKIITAKRQDQQCQKYFDQDDIIENGLDMDTSYMRLKARLFDLF